MKLKNLIKWNVPSTWTIYIKITASLSIILILLLKLPLSEIWAAVRGVSILSWIYLVSAFLIIHLIGVFKWRFITAMGNVRIPYCAALRCYFYGLFGNLFLPSLIGGDLLRMGMATRQIKEKEQVVMGSIMDRFLDLCSLVMLIFLGTLLYSQSLSHQYSKILLISVIALASFLIALFLFVLIPLPHVTPKKVYGMQMRTRLVIFHLIKNPSYTLVAFTLAMVMQGSFVLLNALLGSLCGIELNLLIWFIAWPLAKITAVIVPLSFGGLGVREVALGALFAPFGILYSTSVGYGFVWEAVVIFGSVIGFLLTMLPLNVFFLKNHSQIKNT